MIKISLPIDAIIPQIQEYLTSNNNLILQATPGAGKTTRVPPALLKVTEKKILVLEPRRLAARLSAYRVAQEMGEECGTLVGYQVRFEKKESKNTRIKFITEGLFLRLLLANPSLNDVGCVVLDEFHERHIHSDVALMLVHLLQKTTRPDLKLVIMSATLETKSLAEYLPDAKVFICETKNYPVTLEYIQNDFVKKPLEIKVLFAVEKILKDPLQKGHILVFLPGRLDIAKCAQQLKELPVKICQLSADTSFEEQQEIFLETSQRKIILATNVAETSITIEGVTVVIDSGLAKISGHAAWSGLPTLELKPISKSSCIQRSGRAGRTAPGHTMRLFTQYEYNLRPQFEVPEIQRVDLTQTILELKNISSQELPWFEQPIKSIADGCSNLLKLLSAFHGNNELTEIGKIMSQYSLHPRLSRILYEGKQRNIFAQSILVVCLLSEGMILKNNAELKEFSHSDIAYQIKLFQSKSSDSIIDKTQVKKVENLCRQMCSSFKISYGDCFLSLAERDLSLILFSGFPDRVCKFRMGKEYNLCLGGSAILSRSSTVVEEEFILALMAEELSSKTQIMYCHGIDKNLLLTEEKQETGWNSDKKSAFKATRYYYENLVVKEELIHGHCQELENVLGEELKKSWPLPFDSDNTLQYFNTRIKLSLNCVIPFIQGEEFELFLCSICEGKKSFAQISERDLSDYIEEYIGYEKMQKLNALLPTHITVGKGRKIQVHYEEDKPPYIMSRLQDFFGTLQTPRILNNKISLVVHLLAPNMQSVQVTTDLAGFWERGYQEVRKELGRKYPRHPWPEDPKNAEPPELVVRKKR